MCSCHVSYPQETGCCIGLQMLAALALHGLWGHHPKHKSDKEKFCTSLPVTILAVLQGGSLLPGRSVRIRVRTGCSMALTHSLASVLMAGQGSVSKSSLPFKMASKIWCSVSPQNGGTPHSRMYSITPHDQMSASFP